MNNLFKKFKTQLIMAVVLCCVNMGFAQQPLVQVPSGCNVVVAGTGGTAGSGGKVGNGGIVCMPDPFDDASALGDFTYLPINAANVLTGWSLLGDLSIQTTNTAGAAIQSAGAISPINLESHNKVVRPAEFPPLSPLSDKKWGRSKGRVTVSYTAAPCNSSITFEIYKTYTNILPSWVPPIVGPPCVEPLKTYTYSVDQIASDNADDNFGFDKYYWSGIPAGATDFYTSADKSSITFTTGAVVAPFTLQCCYGRCNTWDGDAGGSHTTCVSKLIQIVPTLPTFSSAQPNGCLNTGATSFVININAIAGHNYTWSAPGTTWILTPSGTPVGQILTVTAVDNNPGTLLLTVTNGSCQPVVFQYAINRNFVAPSATIAGPICVVAGSTANAYSIQTNASLNPTTWTLPAGWSITPGSANGTNSALSITVPLGALAGAYTLSAKSNSCPGIISLIVYVKPSLPAFVGGGAPLCVTRGTTGITSISVTPIPGVPAATGYSWLPYPSGWTCSTGCTTATPTFIPSGNTAGPVTVTVTASSATGCSTSNTRTINYNPVAPNSITTSCWSIGVAGTTTVTVANRPVPFFGSYTVTSAPAGLFSSFTVNAATGIITLNTLATALPGSYVLTITHTTTSCGNSSAVAMPAIIVAGNGASMVTSPSPGVGNNDAYVANGPGGSVYTWFINGSPAVASPTVTITNNVLQLSGNGVPPTSVCANVTSGGCTTRVCATTIGTHSTKTGNTSLQSTIDGITISPNPNTGNFYIKVDNFIDTAEAILTDITGKKIATYTLHKGDNKIQNEGIAKGTYLVVLKIDGKQETRQIIIK